MSTKKVSQAMMIIGTLNKGKGKVSESFFFLSFPPFLIQLATFTRGEKVVFAWPENSPLASLRLVARCFGNF